MVATPAGPSLQFQADGDGISLAMAPFRGLQETYLFIEPWANGFRFDFGFSWDFDYEPNTPHIVLDVPLWFPTILFGAWPAFTLCGWLKRRVARRSV